MQRKVKRGILIVAIFAAAIGGAGAMYLLKPPPETRAAADTELLVDVMRLEQTTASFLVRSQGTVRPLTETILSAEVSGTIVEISPKFVAGGVFAQGEELMRIDPTNYEVAVERAEALLQQRQIEFDGAELLRNEGYRAEAEWASASAALAAARADLVRANRDLERTVIRLPYDGMVRSRETDLGQYVNPGTRLGVMFATDHAEVRLPLTDRDLAFVELPAAGSAAESGGPVVDLSAVQRGETAHWPARIVRTEGVVDETNRVTYAVARITDPYRRSSGPDSGPPLPMGTFVAASIEGTTVRDVIRVPRTALRGNDQLLFVDEDNRLRIGTVTVLRADAEFAWLSGGARPGDRVSLTAIESPVNGMRVRTNGLRANGDSGHGATRQRAPGNPGS